MNIPKQYTQLAQAELAQTRRHFFSQCGLGLGTMALAQLLQQESRGAAPKIDPAEPMAVRRLATGEPGQRGVRQQRRPGHRRPVRGPILTRFILSGLSQRRNLHPRRRSNACR